MIEVSCLSLSKNVTYLDYGGDGCSLLSMQRRSGCLKVKYMMMKLAYCGESLVVLCPVRKLR
jgi:hypothetical protein